MQRRTRITISSTDNKLTIKYVSSANGFSVGWIYYHYTEDEKFIRKKKYNDNGDLKIPEPMSSLYDNNELNNLTKRELGEYIKTFCLINDIGLKVNV